jgi:Na+/proline symporter
MPQYLTWLDWAVLAGTLLFIVGFGIWKTRKQNADFLVGHKENWFGICISIMATQASAITFLSTPGQAFNDGLGFIQFYFGLPLAMVVLSITVVPIFHKLQVFTAYQYLEERFGVSTRTLTSFLFLLQRGLSTGITIYAPAIILSTVLGWDLSTTIVFIGGLDLGSENIVLFNTSTYCFIKS